MFAQNWKGLPAKARALMKRNAAKIALAAGTLAVPLATSGTSALEINTTDIDVMFDAVNDHIIPKVGETISAMPSLLIPLAFLLVLLMIIFFVPDILYTFLDSIKGAVKGRKK